MSDINRIKLVLFLPLRNKLEHKFMPELDAHIFAECQSMLLNFDKVVETEKLYGLTYARSPHCRSRDSNFT